MPTESSLLSYLLPVLFRRDLPVEVSGVVDDLELVEDVSTRQDIHCQNKTQPITGTTKKPNEILETIITQNSSDLSESESLSTSNVNSREMSSSLLTSLSKRTCLEKTKNFGLFFLAQSPDRCKSRKKHSPSFQIFVTLSPKSTFRTSTSTSKMPVFCGDCRPQRRSFFG